MKAILLSIYLIFASVAVNAQDNDPVYAPARAAKEPISGDILKYDASTGQYKAQGVIEVGSEYSKDQIFTKSKEWIALNYRSANDVIQLADKEDGKIICKGNFISRVGSGGGRINHTLILAFKDGRFRYEVTDLVYVSPDYKTNLPLESSSLGRKQKFVTTVEEDILATVGSIKKHVSTATAKDNDW